MRHMVGEHYAPGGAEGGSFSDFFTAAPQDRRAGRVARLTAYSPLHHSIFTPAPASRGSLSIAMSEHNDRARTIRVDDLEIAPGEGLVRAGGRVLTLSVREFQLLVAMVEHAGGIVGRAELCRAVWGRELRAGDRSVDVYVSKLRAKLEQAVPDRRYIHTHPSFGYRFQSQPATELHAAATHVHARREPVPARGGAGSDVDASDERGAEEIVQ
jgi:DNA-binding winged helix-turn-helix (wHTH) protein